MTDQCVVRRPTGETVPNPDFTVSPVLEVIYDPRDPRFRGRCYITGDRPYESTVESAGASSTTQRVIAVFPVEAGPFESGDIVTMLGSRLQPRLVGRSFRLAGPDERSHQSSQRMFVDFNDDENVPPWEVAP